MVDDSPLFLLTQGGGSRLRGEAKPPPGGATGRPERSEGRMGGTQSPAPVGVPLAPSGGVFSTGGLGRLTSFFR